MYAVILEDTIDHYCTVTVFDDDTWWAWLMADDMPRDGASSWTIPVPPSMAALHPEGETEIDVSVGSYQNDKAQHLHINTEGTPLDWDPGYVNGSQDNARKKADELAGEPVTDVYFGLWY